MSDSCRTIRPKLCTQYDVRVILYISNIEIRIVHYSVQLHGKKRITFTSLNLGKLEMHACISIRIPEQSKLAKLISNKFWSTPSHRHRNNSLYRILHNIIEKTTQANCKALLHCNFFAQLTFDSNPFHTHDLRFKQFPHYYGNEFILVQN